MIRSFFIVVCLFLSVKCSGQKQPSDREFFKDYRVVFYVYSQYEFDSLKLLAIDRVRFNDELADFFLNSESLIARLNALGIKSYSTDQRYIKISEYAAFFDKFSKPPGYGIICFKTTDKILIEAGLRTESEWEKIIEDFFCISF